MAIRPEVESLSRAANTKSCPELESMISRAGMRLPTTVGRQSTSSQAESSQTESENGSPRLHRRHRRHHRTDQLPKFSISLEEAEALAVRCELGSPAYSGGGQGGPTSLPACTAGQGSGRAGNNQPEVNITQLCESY